MGEVAKWISYPFSRLRKSQEVPVSPLGVVPHPCDFRGVARFYQEDPDVYIAVNTIAASVCGRGYEIRGDLNPEQRRWVEERFENYCPESTFMDALRQVVLDLNLLGNGYLELARDSEGLPVNLWWIPATEVYRLEDQRGYIQELRGRRLRFNNYVFDSEERRRLAESGQWFQGANEILHFRLPNPNSRDYGLPPTYTVMKDILADSASKDSNLAFFRNGLAPDFAIVVKGGTLSDTSLEMIRRYLEDAHQGPDRHHGFLVLESSPVPGGPPIEIELVPIQQKMTDLQFGRLRQLSIETKIRAFRVPMSKAGINQYGRLGEASSKGEDDTFKYQVVEPQQTQIERVFTRMLREDFGIPEAEFRFREIDLKDERETARMASLLAGGAALLTVNEARALIGLPPLPEGEPRSGGIGNNSTSPGGEEGAE